ncbi:hypothetical protein A3J36_01100 [Candidatus Uhrbacteria bacterium RIFCSPLOWO2_02_FULL_54_37]|uniref:DUF4430 domain-containing protein n=2 Tax=Candidatus Uhriibacteriota TaxID=1752732 RepID=A0A1F7VGI2_9BACT|nr:MAG: hypothetical protein A3B36_00520 [Candidatus Uhrbacteria bacterium RIFCSPLOWO2_01_FULL_55_36]OGL89616.1 MAG: hypothetical protein A3J36_01100 [Candidatus Uhrbacteria bacterium RIFCSPLOWO2_02_FULL_54_37]
MTLKCTITLLIISFLIPSFSLKADDPIARAKAYLAAKPSNPWTTMARVAAGETDVPTDHLRAVDTSAAITIEAPMLAIAAAGHDPRTFAGEDLAAKLKSFHSGGQLGDPGLLNDDIFGILALSAAGVPSSDPAMQDAKATILTAQEDTGSWGDTNMTAVAIQALLEAGMHASDSAITAALSWLKGTQNDDGGFPYSWPLNAYSGAPDPSDSSSSSWVAHAVRKAGQDPTSSSWEKNGKDAIDALLSLQQENGSFAHSASFATETSFTPISTAYAIIAFAGKSLPVAKFIPANNNGDGGNNGNNANNETISFRIEGFLATVCTGTLPLTHTPDALDVIPAASSQCGFTYDIVQASFGPYLKTINADAAQGLTGWLYRVNWTLPDVGAADYALHAGDEVLWNYGDFEWTPLRLTVSSSHVESDHTVKVTIQQFNHNEWTPVAATLYGGTESIQSDAQGTVTMSLPDGVWNIWAEAEDRIRSNRVSITVGSGNGQSVGLTVKVTPAAGGGGGSQGGTLSFVVEPSTMAFGAIAAGSSGARTLTLRTTGTMGAAFTSTVHGDALFVDNLQLDNTSWRSFNASLGSSASRNVNASLAIPSNSATGVKQGTLVFWAQGQ